MGDSRSDPRGRVCLPDVFDDAVSVFRSGPASLSSFGSLVARLKEIAQAVASAEADHQNQLWGLWGDLEQLNAISIDRQSELTMDDQIEIAQTLDKFRAFLRQVEM